MAVGTTSVALKRNGGSVLAQSRELLKKAVPDLADAFIPLDPSLLQEPLEHIKSGSLVIDHVIGGKTNAFGIAPCPGLPRGKIIHLYGASSCGKTTVALMASAEVIRQGGCVGYIDWENEIVPDYCAALGIPIGDQDKFQLVQPETLEDGFKALLVMARMGVDLLVIDSVGAGVPKSVFELPVEEIGKTPRVGLMAQAWSNFLPQLKGVIAKSGTVVIGISQVRKNINTTGYGGDDLTVQGGEAWKFYPAVRLRLARIAQEKRKEINPITNKSEDTVYGGVIKVKVDKNKVSSGAGAEQLFYIRWGQGVDNIRSIIEVAKCHNIIKQGGAWYSWTDPQGKSEKFQGMEGLHKAFKDNKGMFDALYSQTLPKMGIGASLKLSEDMEELDAEAQLIAELNLVGKGVQTVSADSQPGDMDLS